MKMVFFTRVALMVIVNIPFQVGNLPVDGDQARRSIQATASARVRKLGEEEPSSKRTAHFPVVVRTTRIR